MTPDERSELLRLTVEALAAGAPSAPALLGRVLGEDPARGATSPELTSDDDLARQILAHPTDDTPRLVLADRLQEREDPRGELIAVQVALGRGVDHMRQPVMDLPPDWVGNHHFQAWDNRELFTRRSPPNRAELEAREADLLAKHQGEWLAPIGRYFTRWYWWRGFLDLVEGPAHGLLDGAERIAASHPARFMLEELDEAAADRLRHTSLAGVTRLGAMDVTPATLRGFLGENLSHLDTLYLGGHSFPPLGDPGVVQLAQESQLHGLRKLGLPVCGLGIAGLRALASSPVFDNMEELYLGDAPFSAVDELVSSQALPKLKRVVVAGKAYARLSA